MTIPASYELWQCSDVGIPGWEVNIVSMNKVVTSRRTGQVEVDTLVQTVLSYMLDKRSSFSGRVYWSEVDVQISYGFCQVVSASL